MTARVFEVCASPRMTGPGPSSRRRRTVLDVDLNEPAPEHSHSNEAGASTHTQGRHGRQPQPQPPSCVTIDVDVDSIDDDDVLLSSPRSFDEAKNKSRRGPNRTNIVDVESGSRNRDTARNKRQKVPANRHVPANQPVINCESYVIPDSNSGNGRTVASQTRVFVEQQRQQSPPPPEPTFTCPVCMGPLVEEMSTKCGHIFCKACIKKAIGFQSKCPTCRKKVTARDTFRIYLPKTS